MPTRNVQFLISVPAENETSQARQFLLNLTVSLEAASEEVGVEGIELTLCGSTEETTEGPVPCSPGPALENPNPGGTS